MCLLERIVDWDDQRIVLETDDAPVADESAAPQRPPARRSPVRVRRSGDGRARCTESRAPPAAILRRECWSRCDRCHFACDYIEALAWRAAVEAECLQAYRRACSMRFGSRMPANCWLKVARQSC